MPSSIDGSALAVGILYCLYNAIVYNSPLADPVFRHHPEIIFPLFVPVLGHSLALRDKEGVAEGRPTPQGLWADPKNV